MTADLIDIRWAEPADADALAELHAEAWRYAYRGVIPGVALERMIGRRGRGWWGAVSGGDESALVLEFNGRIAGYASLGPSRQPQFRRRGEIYELYMKPEFHGVGFGRRLFEEARRRLDAQGARGLVVWAITANTIACRFYQAMGGKPKARCPYAVGGASLELAAYIWP